MTPIITSEIMEHAHGQWAGPRPMWWTVTDPETGYSIRYNDEGIRRGQYRMRAAAIAALELFIDAVKQ